MLYLLFTVGLLWLVGKLIMLAIKATWGVVKILFYIIFFPIVLIGLVIGGLIYVALPILILCGIFALLCGK